MNTTTRTLSVLSASALLAGSAQAVTLFADNFDRDDSTNLNASGDGKSGTLSTSDWIEVASSGNPFIENDTLRIGETNAGAGWSIAYLNHNFTDGIITTGGEFTVSVDLSGSLGSSGSVRFLGFAVGSSFAEVSGWTSNNPTSTFTPDFFFGYDPTSGGTAVGAYVYKNGTTQDHYENVNLSGVATDTLSVRFSGISDFDAGSTVNYEAFINGSSIKTGSFTWSGNDENYINVYSNYTQHQGRLDNFSVTAVPEPGSLALLGLGGLMIARRRRQA